MRKHLTEIAYVKQVPRHFLLFRDPPTADAAPATHHEPYFAYVQRSGRPAFGAVRALMQAWVDSLPRVHRAEMVTRLRSPDNHHFEAAFFELYVHALFTRIGFGLRLHPPAGARGRRPDFLATKDGAKLLIEAATIGEADTAGRGERARLNRVLDALNEVTSGDYFLRVEHLGRLASPLPIRRMQDAVQRFIGALSYSNVLATAQSGQVDQLPAMEFSHGEFRLVVSVLPVAPDKRGTATKRRLGMIGPGEVAWIDYRTPVRDKVRAKASHYGRLRRPLVVAINAAGRRIDDFHVMEALFGREEWRFPADPAGGSGALEFSRSLDGALLGPRGPQHRAVSAVMVVSSLLPWTVAVREPVMYHNPWARYPLTDVRFGISERVPKGNRMVARPGRPVHELLELPSNWPGDD